MREQSTIRIATRLDNLALQRSITLPRFARAGARR